MTEVVPPKAPVTTYNLRVEGNKIGEFGSEMDLAMAISRYIAFNGRDNTHVDVLKDGVQGDCYREYFSLKLPDLFIFANKALADMSVLNAKVNDLQNKYKELKDLVSPPPVEAQITAEPQAIAS